MKESPSQTAGPYVHIGLMPNFCGINGVYPRDLGTSPGDKPACGRRVSVEGHVFDGAGAPMKDVLIETWQADAAGLYQSDAETRGQADPDFGGWARCATDGTTGLYRFETIKPGPVPFPGGGVQAPHISFWIVARGINLGLNTRMYFAEDVEPLAKDPVLNRIEHRDRLSTIIIAETAGTYRFDIRIQGQGETIFFDI
jgi:protocatechuate 3,4-dioxygenase alpha subunit